MSYVALITGATSGIGEATARRLAEREDTQLVLVARREERLNALAGELPGNPTVIVADLADAQTPSRIAQTVEREHGALNLLVNNAGARWSAAFEQGGWENVERHMRVNFEAPVRLVEALLPLLRATVAQAAEAQTTSANVGPQTTGASASTDTAGAHRAAGQRTSSGAVSVAIVNVSSTSGRLARRGTGGYAASKFAFAGWSDALALELAPVGIHVGLVLPGFIATEGFPQAELRAKPLTRWMVSDASVVVDAILEAGPGGRAERYAPRYYVLFAAARILAPNLVRRALNRGTFTTATESR